MVYRAIGLMSGSSLDGLDIVFAEFHEQASNWRYEILHSACYPYPEEWTEKLKNAINLGAREYQLLHADYGHYTGKEINRFIEEHGLQYKVNLVASHGHTSFHMPQRLMTAQLGDGAAIAAETKLPVVSDLRALDVAFGGQGAPIVPVGEKLLLNEYDYFLNLGGIANISVNDADNYIAFDICPANRVLNMIANTGGEEFDDGGKIAASGVVENALLERLNELDYYKKSFPKSLANDFGTDIVFPMIQQSALSIPDALRTYVEHIAFQVNSAIPAVDDEKLKIKNYKLLITGGGAFNQFLIKRLSDLLSLKGIEVVVPGSTLVNYKEALIMAFIGVLRWRQEYNVLSSVTGASQNSIGGALWVV